MEGKNTKTPVQTGKKKESKIEKQLRLYVPSLLPWAERIHDHKLSLLSKGKGLYTENGSAADRLYIIDYYELHKDIMPAEAEEEIEAYIEKNKDKR